MRTAYINHPAISTIFQHLKNEKIWEIYKDFENFIRDLPCMASDKLLTLDHKNAKKRYKNISIYANDVYKKLAQSNWEVLFENKKFQPYCNDFVTCLKSKLKTEIIFRIVVKRKIVDLIENKLSKNSKRSDSIMRAERTYNSMSCVFKHKDMPTAGYYSMENNVFIDCFDFGAKGDQDITEDNIRFFKNNFESLEYIIISCNHNYVVNPTKANEGIRSIDIQKIPDNISKDNDPVFVTAENHIFMNEFRKEIARYSKKLCYLTINAYISKDDTNLVIPAFIIFKPKSSKLPSLLEIGKNLLKTYTQTCFYYHHAKRDNLCGFHFNNKDCFLSASSAQLDNNFLDTLRLFFTMNLKDNQKWAISNIRILSPLSENNDMEKLRIQRGECFWTTD